LWPALAYPAAHADAAYEISGILPFFPIGDIRGHDFALETSIISLSSSHTPRTLLRRSVMSELHI
jgi:hypothetical protein